MLVIPIAQEQSTVRRHPWVSYGIIALNVAVFVGIEVLGGAQQRESELSATHRELIEHVVRHPYLEIPRTLAPHLPSEMLAALDRARERAYRRGEVPPPGQLELLQSQLNDLATRYEEQLWRLPSHRFGYVPSRPRAANLVTTLFVHAGVMHLIGNMLFFFLSGPFIEDAYGRPLFAGFYLASGIVATKTHALFHPDSAAALVGASGAIAGVMGAFLVRYGRRRIRFLLLPIPILPQIRTQFLMPAFVVLPFWAGQQLLFAHSDLDASGTAWWAHIGGFAFGLLVAVALRAAKVEERYISPSIERSTTLTAHPSLERILDARVAGDLATARAELTHVLRQDPNNAQAWEEAYELALAEGDPQEVVHAASRLFELYARAGDHDLQANLLHDGRWRSAGSITPQLGLAVASALEREGDFRGAVELLAEVVRSYPKDPRTLRALVRQAELLASAGDTRGARAALEQARKHPSYGPPWTEVVERAMADLAASRGSATP